MKAIIRNKKIRVLVCIAIIISLMYSTMAPTIALAGNQSVWRHVLNADLTEYQGERFPISLAETEENPAAIDLLPDEANEEDYEIPGADGLITYRTPMPTAREGLGVVAIGKKIYAIGGQFNTTYFNKVEIYDTTTDTWTTGTNMTYGVSYFSCVAVGTDIYCFGGYNGSYRNYVQVYDTVANRWSSKTAMTYALMGTAAIEYNGSIYVSGGYDGAFRNYLNQYNISANNWTARTAIKNARAYHNAFMYDGNMYIEGGTNSITANTAYVNIEEIYNLNTYEATANGVSRVYGMNAAAICRNNQLTVIGGSGQVNNNYRNQIVQKNMLDGNTTNKKTNFMFAGRASLGAAMVDGIVYMIGGRDDKFIYNTVEAMEPGYTYLAEMPENLAGFEAVELGGNIYVAGGYTLPGHGTSRAMYAYNIINKTWQRKADLPGVSSTLLSAVYGKLYLFDYNISNSPRVFEYDPQTNTWTDIAPAYNMFDKVQSLNGRVYALYSGISVVDVFDPMTKTWRQAASRPGPTSIKDTAELAGKLYLLGSDGMIYRYDPLSNSWTVNSIGYETSFITPVYQDLYLFEKNSSNETKNVYRYSPEVSVATYYSSFLHEYNYFHQTCAVNNKVYIFAGNSSESGAGAIVEYMPSISPWAQRQAPSFSNAYMASAAIDGKIYLAGGNGAFNGGQTTSIMRELFEYDTQTDTWSQKANMPTARSKTAGAVVGGKFYAIGGETTTLGTATNKVEEYDPATNTWATKAVLPSNAHSVATATYNGKIYSFGGRTILSGVINNVYEYDPATNTWTTKTAMPTARYGASAAELDGKIYVAGGFNSSGIALNTLQVYDPVANNWSTKAVMPEARAYCGAVADGCIYVIGGSDSTTSYNTVLHYIPSEDKWYYWPGLDNNLEGAATLALNSGIYVINGKNPYTPFYPYSGNFYAATSFPISDYAELIHLGSDRINPSGNLSRSYNDFSFDAPGFLVNVSRVYNSIDTRNSLFSKGWGFGFSSKLEVIGSDTVIRMPDGRAITFRLDNNGVYTAKDSRSKLVKSGSEHILTTKDHYQYHYNANGYMYRMTDSNGNQINLTVNANGQVIQAADAVGRTLVIAYINNRISTITESATGRVAVYTYDSGSRLSQVTAPDGSNTYYTYNSDGLLYQVKDHSGAVLEEFTYETAPGYEQKRIKTAKLPSGNTQTFTYEVIGGKVTTTDGDRASTTYFDKALYPIAVIDAEGGQQHYEYSLDGGINRFGEIKSSTDRNGNTTFYEYDNWGNVTKIICPDRSTKLLAYDSNDNLISETDERGNKTFYTYDSSYNLLKRIKPLNGVMDYSPSADQSLYAIESFIYYTPAEAMAMCGKVIGGLLKMSADAAGSSTSYTYDAQGNLATSKDSLNRVTTYSFNTIGWLKQQTSPMGYTTYYYYDKAGRLLKKTQHGGESERYVYDLLGNLSQSISPKQYSVISDLTAYNTENIVNITAALVNTVGYRYTHTISGLVATVKDPLNNTTTNTYDNFGNKTKEILANGSTYIYNYDKLNRLTGKSYQEGSNSILLESYSYPQQTDGTSKQTTRVYFSDTDYADTTYIYDFAGRLLRTINPDGGVVNNTYLANGLAATVTDARGSTTYFEYNPMNQMAKRWIPHDDSLYSLSEWQYDGAGRVTQETNYVNALAKGVTPSGPVAIKNHTYNIDNTVKDIIINGAGKTSYLYNNDGLISQETRLQEGTRSQQTDYTYNYRGNIATSTVYAENKDLGGRPDDTDLYGISTIYSYDINSNLEKVIYANGETVGYEYDLLNRQTAEKRNILNENNISMAVSNTTSYDNMGNVTATADEKGNTTNYFYNSRGFLQRLANAQNAVTSREYDLQGRLVKEYSPRALLEDEPGHIVPPSLGYWPDPAAYTANNYTVYTYDEMGRILTKSEYHRSDYNSMVKALVTETNTYDQSGNLLTTKDALNNTTTYTYDNAGRLIKVSDALSQDTRFSYDGLGRMTQQTDARGVISQNSYDLFGNIIQQKVDGATVKSAAYDLLGNCLTVSDANGNTTSTVYSLAGKPRNVTTANGYDVRYWYDVMGNNNRSLNSLNKEVLNSYDGWGRLLSVSQRKSDGSGAISCSTRYDVLGNPVYVTNERGFTTQYDYDKLNRLIATTNPLGQTDSIAYDANGNKVAETNWRGNINTYRYDILNRLIAVIDQDGIQAETLTYTDTHRQATSTDALGHTSSFTYDKLGRLIAVTDAEGYSNSKNYDAMGNIISKTDGNNQVTSFSYDNFNRLINVTGADDAITRFSYDAVGNLLSQTDGCGNTTLYEYNELNQPILRADPGALPPSAKPTSPSVRETDNSIVYDESRVERFSYYPDGKLYSRRDKNGAITSYEYDIHGRKIGKYVNDAATSYEYDNIGNLLKVADAGGAIVRTYDQLNRVTSKTVPVFGTTTFGYDLTGGLESGQIGSSTTIDGRTVTRVYDKTGRLAKVKDGSDETGYEYYDNGSLKTQAMPNGVTANYTYFDNNNLQTLENKLDGLILEAYQYTYDGAGNITAKQDVKGTTVYTYTPVNQLTTVSEPNPRPFGPPPSEEGGEGKQTAYAYDASGNRQNETVTHNGQTMITNYTVDEQNRLICAEQTINAQTIIEQYCYDDAGNMLSCRPTALSETDGSEGSLGISLLGQMEDEELAPAFYSYNDKNQLVQAINGSAAVSNTFNAEGLRFSKTVDDTTIYYCYEYNQVIKEQDSEGGIAYNLYGTNLISRELDGNKVYYIYNGHGDVTGLLSENGAIIASYYYDAFGNITEQSGNFSNPYHYSGYIFDKESCIYNLNARFYDAKLARFMQEDTYRGNKTDPLSLNLYTYCFNNPLKYWDPSGNVVTDWDLANCSPDQIAQIKAATDAWNNATTPAEKDAAHAMANEARSGNLSSGQSITSSGYVTNSNGSYASGGNSNVYLNTSDTSNLISSANKQGKASDNNISAWLAEEEKAFYDAFPYCDFYANLFKTPDPPPLPSASTGGGSGGSGASIDIAPKEETTTVIEIIMEETDETRPKISFFNEDPLDPGTSEYDPDAEYDSDFADSTLVIIEVTDGLLK